MKIISGNTGSAVAAIFGIIFIASIGVFVYFLFHENIIATPTVLPPSSPPAIKGVIEGKVTIGPICPVERIDRPCQVPPSTYTSRKIILYAKDGVTKLTEVALDGQGNFHIDVPPGIYVIDMTRNGIERITGLPQLVTITSGSIAQLTINIDTGIR